ncbi:MAG TPA: hypothetical protein VMM82_00240, partial [Spirochaetia bacterium]|nr:hypothetical protein [Spirochaetia bacterium]
MRIDTPVYIAFLAGVWLLHQLTPQRHRWLTLFLASLGFYATLVAPLLLVSLGLEAALAWGLGNRMSRRETGPSRLRLLWVGIAVNIAIMVFVKYLQQLAGAFVPSAVPVAADAHLFVTVGVSYFTLQSISYLADIYLGRIPPEPHLGRLALFLGFFPKLLQGPIERGGDLLPQLRAADPVS